MSLSWQQLHELVGVPCEDQRVVLFSGISSLDEAGPDDISFLGNPRYQSQLPNTRAGAVLVAEGEWEVPDGCALIKVENPSAAFSKIIDYFQAAARYFVPGISSGAHIAEDVEIDPAAVMISAGVVIESGAKVGKGTAIGAGCVVGRKSVIGEDCLLHPNATVREECILGNRVILQPGVVVGSDGYGFELVDGRHQKVPQVGIVELEDDVEVGANSCIDRARFGRTLIGEGTKIDNLVQIAHNVKVGKHTLIVAQSGIAGSTRIGNYVTVAAQVGVVGHIEIGDQVVLATRTAAMKSLKKPGVYMGSPARPMADEQKKMAAMPRVPKLLAEVRELKKKLDELRGE
ncbi:MAG: UDP-3-O-(3-hydroxymyristoyl)glucosamine N-acyltransferase [Akkermansiaceae bacterium]|nr:UDP-3-O-(3-hydroxymyristoyl)glucosamine N-acyltransferase [Akkermansiaceae bacterium]